MTHRLDEIKKREKAEAALAEAKDEALNSIADKIRNALHEYGYHEQEGDEGENDVVRSIVALIEEMKEASDAKDARIADLSARLDLIDKFLWRSNGIDYSGKLPKSCVLCLAADIHGHTKDCPAYRLASPSPVAALKDKVVEAARETFNVKRTRGIPWSPEEVLRRAIAALAAAQAQRNHPKEPRP